MKYKLLFRKYWWCWFKQDIKRIYYRLFHNINCYGFHGTLLPSTGKGQFVSVYSKGNIIQIKQEDSYSPNLEFDEIRIIPCQPNHGVMVERFKNGVMADRQLLSIDQLNKDAIFASNIEQLVRN